MLKSLLLSLLLLAGISSDSYAHSAANNSALAAKSRLAVVDLEFPDDDMANGWFMFCSGVAVGRHTVMTQKHCVVAAKERGVDIYYNREHCPSDGVVATYKDVVLVRTCHEWPVWAKISNSTPNVGDRMYEYGHPYGMPALYREGYLAAKVFDNGDQVWGDIGYTGMVWIWDTNITHGDSGGPIFNSKGEVICTVSFGIHRDGDGFQVMGCYPPWFSRQEMARIR